MNNGPQIASKKALILLFALIYMPFHRICSQDRVADRKVLMTVAGRDVEAGEFIRMYRKSLSPGDKPNPDNYLQQFINFKLKVADAISMGYDTTKAFRDELNGYRKQLAQSYLTDPRIKEKLLRNAYERSLTEVNASHILVSCRMDARPADTLKAYDKALAIRQRVINGEPFEKVAKETSDDRSVSVNGGNLGYFTVFQMISPFENTAYNMRPGEVSMPVRTSFGYHIIKVLAKRPSQGKIRVAHIMKAIPQNADDAQIMKLKESIDSIYLKLKNGGSFRELAAKYSDHKQSSSRGGEIDWFGAGEIIPDFSEAAFSIKDTGEYTLPVKTIYGYHIIKLLGRKPPASFEESRPYLESKINQADLESLGRKSFVAGLKKEYNFRIRQTLYNWFVTNTDTLKMKGKMGYDTRNLPKGDIFSFADQHLSGEAFAALLEKKAKALPSADPVKFIDSGIESIAADLLTEYEDRNLERKYPDFRYLMNEFHDGILLFDISSEKVWNKVQQDSVNLHKYYLVHKNDSLAGTISRTAGDTTSGTDVQTDMISEYQDWLTEEWLKQLKEKYSVKINEGLLQEVKKQLENE